MSLIALIRKHRKTAVVTLWGVLGGAAALKKEVGEAVGDLLRTTGHPTAALVGLAAALGIPTYLVFRRDHRNEKQTSEFAFCKPCETLEPEDFRFEAVQSTRQSVKHDHRPYLADIYISRTAVDISERHRPSSAARRYNENDIEELLRAGESVLLVGVPGEGKSHLAFQVVRRLEGFVAVQPIRDRMPGDEAFETLRGRDVVLILDDLSRYGGASVDLLAFQDRLARHARRCVLLATAYDLAALGASELKSTPLMRIYERFPHTLWLTKPSSGDFERLKRRVGASNTRKFPTLGAVCMDEIFRTMRKIFESSEKLGKDSREALRAMELLSAGGVEPLTHARVQLVMNDVLQQPISGAGLRDALRPLSAHGFLRSSPQADPIEAEAAYLVGEEVAHYYGTAPPETDVEKLFECLLLHDDVQGANRVAFTRYANGSLTAAVSFWEKVIRKFSDAPEPSLHEHLALAFVNRGAVLSMLGEPEQAIACYDEVNRRFGDAAEPALGEQLARALAYKGFALGRLGRTEEEVACYDEVIRRFTDASELALREQLAHALNNKGVALGQLGRTEEEVACCDEVIRRFGDASEPAMTEQLARALINKGVALGRLGRTEQEVTCYDRVIRRFGDAFEPALREYVARALVNKRVMLGRLGLAEEEVACYDELIRRFGDASELALREQFAHALSNKGVMLGRLGRPEEELTCYDEVIRRFGDASEPALRKYVAYALVNKSVALGRLGRAEEDVACCDEVIRRFDGNAEPALREYVAYAFSCKGAALGWLGGPEQAIACYDEVIRRIGDASEPALRETLGRALINKSVMLGQLGRAEEEVACCDEVVRRFSDAVDPALKELLARAFVYKSTTLDKLGQTERALACHDEVIRRFGDSSETALSQLVETAKKARG